ncbi:MAG: acyl-CoA dehydrogenase family protein [Parvularculaceae bacterium]
MERVQVHGGMGFIEETGAAQFMRDAKIAEIYEGTNGIQANDLDRGASSRAMAVRKRRG